MKLVKDIIGDVVIFELRGEFDSFVCNPFLEQIDAILAGGFQFVVLNMKQVAFINSTGIGSIIKGLRKLRESNGDLVMVEPSQFVVEVIQHLGIAGMFRTFNSNEEALSHLNVGEGIEIDDGSNILVHPVGQSGSPVVGRIRKLEEEGIAFETEEIEIKMMVGSEVRLKFRLPLFRKSHYFDITAVITEMVHSTTGAMITTQFTHIFDEDRNSIAQFVRDMQFLRREAKEAEKKS